jgi:hypothetical protein
LIVAVVVVGEEEVVLVTDVFLRYSYSNEFVSILVVIFDIRFQLVHEARIERDEKNCLI